MTNLEREKIIESLPFESRLGYVAFCAERCFKEARLHPAAAQELETLPLLAEGLEMIWARAERQVNPDRQRAEAILSHLQTYEVPGPPGYPGVVYTHDFALVSAARSLIIGIRVLLNPQSTPRYVAGVLAGIAPLIGRIYVDGENARLAELALDDTALLRLQEWGNKPFNRAVFDGIPEWPRGELTKRYAQGRMKGSADDDEDEE